MGTVLGAMRNVRWHELQHAYGSASQVPVVLSRIAWGDAPNADEALSDLERWIGAPPVFDSTAATVPFLWELAGTDTVRDRAGVLDLLARILAAGSTDHPAWTRAAHDAVAARRETAAYLAETPVRPASAPAGAGAPAQAVRAAAGRLLAAIDRHACPACPALLPREA
ncbi:hypothetical protein ACF058_00065 [Streptomyces sp. NPDC015501]|uniref:hypothetical protein n=1 Tax=unclassified Streptomyces TaxID=2593676 RepID=UPI00119D20CB|nr:hypothetical protein A3L22_00060 [Streptomyces griseus subsp. griseus]